MTLQVFQEKQIPYKSIQGVSLFVVCIGGFTCFQRANSIFLKRKSIMLNPL